LADSDLDKEVTIDYKFKKSKERLDDPERKILNFDMTLPSG
jgi:hypothetical protein